MLIYVIIFQRGAMRIDNDVLLDLDEQDALIKTLVVPEGIKVINPFALEMGAFDTIVLPNSLKVIEKGAFANSTNLENINLPEHLNSIEENTFNNCTSLKDIKLPSQLTVIRDYAFYNCGLEKLVLPQGVSVIDRNAFENNINLKKVELPEGLHSIGEFSFSKTAIEEISFPLRLTYIGREAFKESKLKKVDIPRGVSEINEYTFSDCYSLEEVRLPWRVTRIKQGAFSNCSNLKQIEFSDRIEYIGSFAFSCCHNLKEINLPQRLKRIGECAFEACSNLEEIKLPEGLEYVDNSAFSCCENLKSIVFPKSIKKVRSGVLAGCSKLQSVTFEGGELENSLNLILSDNLKEIRISKNCKVYNSPQNIDMKYITKKGDYFVLTKNKLSLDSFSLSGINCDIGIVMALWDKREELKDKFKNHDEKSIKVVNSLYKSLDREKFNDFVKNHNLKFIKQLDLTNGESLHNFIKLYYNLGGFLPPVTRIVKNKRGEEVEKTVDYAQKVAEFFKEGMQLEKQQDQKSPKEIFRKFIVSLVSDKKHILNDMNADGIKYDFSDFFLNKENFIAIMQENVNTENFLTTVYNDFEKIQKGNTSNKGNQRQLKPTMEVFKTYLNTDRFQGVTKDNVFIAKALAPFVSLGQIDFERAAQIDRQRKVLGTKNILKMHLKEDPFEEIDKLAIQFEMAAAEALGFMTEVANDNFTYDWLDKNDPDNFVLGKLCSCCSHISGSGDGIMYASIIHPDVQNLVIRDKNGEIVAKSTLYINRREGYGVFNNIEINDDIDEKSKEEIYIKYKLAARRFAQEYNLENPNAPLRQLNVGMDNEANDLDSQIKKYSKEAQKLFKTINYSEFGFDEDHDYNGNSKFSQYIIWKDDEYER